MLGRLVILDVCVWVKLMTRIMWCNLRSYILILQHLKINKERQ